MAKKLGNRSCQSNFDQKSSFFVFFLSYPITTVFHFEHISDVWISHILCVKTETQNIGANVRKKLPDFLLDENKKLDLSKLAETFETQSLKSIREKLISVLGNVFAFMKELFRHTKKVFYVVTMCLMITDGYK